MSEIEEKWPGFITADDLVETSKMMPVPPSPAADTFDQSVLKQLKEIIIAVKQGRAGIKNMEVSMDINSCKTITIEFIMN